MRTATSATQSGLQLTYRNFDLEVKGTFKLPEVIDNVSQWSTKNNEKRKKHVGMAGRSVVEEEHQISLI